MGSRLARTRRGTIAVTQLTENAEGVAVQWTARVEKHYPRRTQDERNVDIYHRYGSHSGSARYALRQDGHGELIVHRPYNNRHNDASAARDYALFE